MVVSELQNWRLYYHKNKNKTKHYALEINGGHPLPPFSSKSAGLYRLFCCYSLHKFFWSRLDYNHKQNRLKQLKEEFLKARDSSPCQSWDRHPLASSTCACRSAPSRGAYLGLTPACGGSSARILQQTNSLPSASGDGRAQCGAEITEARPSERSSPWLLVLLSVLASYLLDTYSRRRWEKQRGGERNSNVAVWLMFSL